MPLYDVFISYSHAKDKPIAAALQSVIQKLGKPWYRRRAIRVFRDDTSLSATPSLWPSIEQALGESRFLVLLASPEAAASSWVDKEVSFWLASKGAQTLLIALTEGELAWDNASGDFLWRDGTPLPPALRGRFAAEPKWVDLALIATAIATAPIRATRVSSRPAPTSLHSRHAERGSAFARSAAAAARRQFGALGRRFASRAGGARRLAMDRGNRAAGPCRKDSRSCDADGEQPGVFDLAQQLRDRAGMPADLVRNILDRARKLQS